MEGLDAVADDYLTKPFIMKSYLLEQSTNSTSFRTSEPNHSVRPYLMDTVSEELSLNGQALVLTAYEYKVMEYLMLNPQKVISKTELTEHIYDQDFDLDSNVIEVFVEDCGKSWTRPVS